MRSCLSIKLFWELHSVLLHRGAFLLISKVAMHFACFMLLSGRYDNCREVVVVVCVRGGYPVLEEAVCSPVL